MSASLYETDFYNWTVEILSLHIHADFGCQFS
jgi:hypothetical protein